MCRQLTGLGVSGGGSVNPARPTAMVITDQKSCKTEIGTALLEEVDTEEKLSSPGGEIFITITVTKGGAVSCVVQSEAFKAIGVWVCAGNKAVTGWASLRILEKRVHP